ncbi:MAG: diaminopimelate epimerase [Gemmatimonadaceae bacterium]|nr:diaminopimelate epimerase [Gemmatimonadaceae bacterium]
MSGSGNDFIVFVSSDGPFGELETVSQISAMCARGTGIGADGAVFIEPAGKNVVAMRYYNADGSRATLCGNASLCSTRLSLELGLASEDFTLRTDAGDLPARIREGLPEIDLEPIQEIDSDAPKLTKQAGEDRIGFALVGVPHVVILVPDLETIALQQRGSELRRDPSLRDGANVNFVTKTPSGWAYRTYERGVEGETLACGSGAVATAVLLGRWGQSGETTVLQTRSGRSLTVRLTKYQDRVIPTLRGEGRLVFEGEIGELA